MNNCNWTLHLGVHNHTITSRDSIQIICKDLEDCKYILKEKERYLRKFGYVIWFADALTPKGEIIKIHEGNSDYQ